MSIRKKNLSFKETFKTLPLSTTKQKYFQLFSEPSGVSYKVASVEFMDSYNLYAYANDIRYQIVENSFTSFIADLQVKISLFNRKNKSKQIDTNIILTNKNSHKTVQFILSVTTEDGSKFGQTFTYNNNLEIWRQSCISELLKFFERLAD